MNDRKITVRDTLTYNLAQSIAAETILDIQEQDETIHPFLLWLNSDVIDNKVSYAEFIVGLVGFFAIGVVSTYSCYPLTVDAIAILTAELSNPYVISSLEIFFGIMAFALTGILVGLPTQSEFQSFERYCLEKKPWLPTSYQKKKSYFAMRAGIETLSCTTGLPFYSLLLPYVANLTFLNIAVPITPFISSYCACISELKKIINQRFIVTAPKDAVRDELIMQFDTAITHVLAKNAMQLKEFYTDFHDSNESDSLAEKNLRALAKIFAEGGVPEENNEKLISPKTFRGKKLFGLFGLVMGMISTCVFFEPSIVTLTLFFEAARINYNDAEKAFSEIFSAISIGTNSSFDGMYAKYDCEHMATAFMYGQRIPSLQAVISHLSAAISSFPSMYLVFAQSSSYLAQIIALPVFIGSTLARDLAFYYLIDRIIDKYHGKTSARMLHKNMRNELTTIRDAIEGLPPIMWPILKKEIMPREMMVIEEEKIPNDTPLIVSDTGFFKRCPTPPVIFYTPETIEGRYARSKSNARTSATL